MFTSVTVVEKFIRGKHQTRWKLRIQRMDGGIRMTDNTLKLLERPDGLYAVYSKRKGEFIANGVTKQKSQEMTDYTDE